MRIKMSLILIIGFAAALFTFCGKDSPNNPEPITSRDTIAIGTWEGTMAPVLTFKGAKIIVDISKIGSLFSLIALDTAKDIAKNPVIKDTTLVLKGAWKLNTIKDSILLVCDSGRIIDTALNTLKPREVKGQVIALDLKMITQNPSTGTTVWEIALADLVPLAPMLGIDLSKFQPSLLKVLNVKLTKKVK